MTEEAVKILISSIDNKIYCTTNCINTWIIIYAPKLLYKE